MPASIYWHFESKEGLLTAVIERAAEMEAQRRWIGVALGGGTAPDALSSTRARSPASGGAGASLRDRPMLLDVA